MNFQSAFCTQSAVYILYPICSRHFVPQYQIIFTSLPSPTHNSLPFTTHPQNDSQVYEVNNLNWKSLQRFILKRTLLCVIFLMPLSSNNWFDLSESSWFHNFLDGFQKIQIQNPCWTLAWANGGNPFHSWYFWVSVCVCVYKKFHQSLLQSKLVFLVINLSGVSLNSVS